MIPARRAWLRVLLAAVIAVGAVAYVVRARAVGREVREGATAYERVCARLLESARVSGSPGSIAHLMSAMQVQLRDLGDRYPRWYAGYVKNPSAYPCGPQEPNTQLGSDR